MNLNSKIAIVTGASSGTGKNFCTSLVEKGSLVYGLARSSDKLAALREELGETFIPVTLDISNITAIDEWVSKTFNEQHTPDILVNNAGVAFFGNVDELPVEDWHTMMNTNLNGVFYLTRKIVPLMKANPSVCHIVNIVSVAGLLGNPQISGYNATKFGLRGFSEALFKELRYDGIKVTAFFPGSINTELFDNIDSVTTHQNMMTTQNISDTLIFILETPDNYLINELTMRPLDPRPPKSE